MLVKLHEQLARFGFNLHKIGEREAHRICQQQGIEVITEDVDSSFVMAAMGRKVIVLSSKLQGQAREFALLHELGHLMLGHVQEHSAHFFGVQDTEMERQASMFAAVAMLPATPEWIAAPEEVRLWRIRAAVKYKL